MEYLVDDLRFSVSYSELKDKYITFCELDDQMFVHRIKDVLHLACIICWFKDIPSSNCLSDRGIVHELVHQVCKTEGGMEIGELRELFKEQLKLA